jgi:hypothetical protein
MRKHRRFARAQPPSDATEKKATRCPELKTWHEPEADGEVAARTATSQAAPLVSRESQAMKQKHFTTVGSNLFPLVGSRGTGADNNFTITYPVLSPWITDPSSGALVGTVEIRETSPLTGPLAKDVVFYFEKYPLYLNQSVMRDTNTFRRCSATSQT